LRRRGELAEALSLAAAAGPAPVRTLAERVQVGYTQARYTCSRMISRGELVVLRAQRPWLLALPLPEAPERPACVLRTLGSLHGAASACGD
jgi:hypothetical protein